MTDKKFRFVIAIVGELPARNRAQAYMIVQMGFALVGRLMGLKPEVAVKVEEIVPVEESTASNLADELFKGTEETDG